MKQLLVLFIIMLFALPASALNTTSTRHSPRQVSVEIKKTKKRSKTPLPYRKDKKQRRYIDPGPGQQPTR